MSATAPTPILRLGAGDVAPYVFLCGDPARVDRIGASWSEAREVRTVREFRVATGSWQGIPVSAASTGVGAPGTAIVVEELARAGARVLVRVGNSGGLAPDLALGDLVVTTGAVRDDGTSRSYVIAEYPAVADYRVVAALVEAARASGARFQAGVTWSLDAFYARNARAGDDGTLASMSFGGYWTPALEARIREMQAARVLNCEMEAGVLLTLASLFGLRAGAICVVSDRTPWQPSEPHDPEGQAPGALPIDLDRNMTTAIAVAHAAVARLVQEDA